MNIELATELAHRPYEDHGFWWVGALIHFLFLALIVVVIVRIVFFRRRHGWYGPPWQHHMGTSSARQILAERYAKGEIDVTEYRERLRELETNPRK